MCPTDDILERVLAGGDDDSSVAWSAHVATCERCSSWLEDARADEAMLGSVKQAWSREHANADRPNRLNPGLTATWRHASRDSDDGTPRIPGFELLRQIGEGGMGVVYEARQVSPSRIVAIKIVRGGTSASEFRNRLIEHEAAALARLRHAHIAAVYSAGRTDNGLFYVAMERIQGIRVTDFATRAMLPLKARLALVETISRAIQHAHQHGVVHGDIKPGNVLMDLGSARVGLETLNGADAADVSGLALSPSEICGATVKVLDFGLSRLVDAGDVHGSPMAAAKVRGTPGYMSPEQASANGAEIDFRSDIYALGAVAYELLTGRPVHDLHGLSIDAALARVREGDITPPSRMNPRLRGDVECVLLKALARNPDDRYVSVADLADDLHRVLTHEPIHARRPSRLYHARCFLRRHAVGCAFAAIVIVGLVAFGAIEMAHARRLTHERDLARFQRDRAQRVSNFMQNMIADLDPTHTGGPDTSLMSVLDDAARRVESELTDDPETAATTQVSIGQGYLVLGQYARAEAQFRSALARRQSVFGPEHGAVAEAMHELGLSLKLQNHFAEAEPLYLQSLEMRRRLLPASDPGIPESLNDLGALCYSQNRFQDAEAYFKEALALRKARLGDQDKEYAVCLGNLAKLQFLQGKAAEAEEMVMQAIALRQRLFGENDPIILKQLTGMTYIAMHRGGDPEVTERLLRELLDRQKRLLGADHPDIQSSITSLATLLRKRGDEAGAQALEAQRSQAPDPQNPQSSTP